ncbi:DeoR/GlpR family DNA-binding transcription regulator [Hymenobacter aerilatus]|uniref:DeoR/GlpR family DNA-binding transcription regulator n=1 Tax=Hymenobacter aerilatus TaxID=2932251 RepID=A0A8T9T1I7_9BACT|nr:DeoR/GlpR family DNA-binding transcription regulator [Hymenobacter aerilatus]UOR06843.1 DeoR/GlpR family DNA-binding transcription regulator [Hymenobacter aerilatus]
MSDLLTSDNAATPRAQTIVEKLLHTGTVAVEELATEFGVSVATIRRDLTELEQQGWLRRTHGGAVPREPLLYEPFRYNSSFHEQIDRNLSEKRRIGLAAAALIQPGEMISLTAGTTTTQVTRSLRPGANVTVITNTVNVAMELSHRNDVRVFVTGGFLTGSWFSLVGPATTQALSQFFVDKLFIGVNGIDAEKGLTSLHPEEASVIQVMVRQAKQCIVVADHTKLGTVATSLICPATKVHQLITDTGATEAQLAPFRALGIDVLLA